MSRSKLSVIIPAYNEERYIRDTLSSFSRQSVPYELIVVANGCTDNTSSIAEDLGAKVMELEIPGVSAARNRGAQIAGGDLLVFNDADTLVAPNYLEAVLNTFEKKQADYGAARAKAEDWRLGTLAFTLMLNVSGCLLKESSGNMFVRRECFEKVAGFDETRRRDEDTLLSVNLRRAGYQYAFLSDTYTITSSRAVSLKRMWRESWSYLRFLATGSFE